MPVVDVKNLQGKTVGQVDLADAVFGARVNPNLLHETSRWYLAGKRSGTHKTKGRADVSGSGRKLWRQKGTGRARIGSIRSPLWRSGGTVHGPVPHKYSYRLPKKMILGALRSALSQKLAEEKLTIVDAWQLDTYKTKALREALTKLNGDSRTILLVDLTGNRNLELASRNMDGVTLSLSRDLQVYDLLRHDGLMLSKEAALRLSSSFSAEGSSEGSREGAEAASTTGAEKPAAATEKKSKAAPAEKKVKSQGKAKAASKPAAKKPARATKPKAPKGKE
jgi:large subunit ribosomal protein L4